ncbi:MAG: hypothetical protein IT389_16250 [Nitrospira sp.]|nr:hypothetical protein [Nitrospira sp.]
MVNPQDEYDEARKYLTQYKQDVGRFSCGKSRAALAGVRRPVALLSKLLDSSSSAFRPGVGEIDSVFTGEAEELSGRTR